MILNTLTHSLDCFKISVTSSVVFRVNV